MTSRKDIGGAVPLKEGRRSIEIANRTKMHHKVKIEDRENHTAKTYNIRFGYEDVLRGGIHREGILNVVVYTSILGMYRTQSDMNELCEMAKLN